MLEELKTIFNKRSIGYFVVMFVVWYPISLILYSLIEVTQNPSLGLVYQFFTPILVLLFAFLYFRKARNDWWSRILISIFWMFLFFFFSALLVQPIYGFSWQSIINWPVISANWVNFIAVIVGALIAKPTTGKLSARLQATSQPSLDQRLREQESKIQQLPPQK